MTARLRAWSVTRRQRRRAELESEGKYLAQQYRLVDKFSEEGAKAELRQQEACVKKEIENAEKERDEVRRKRRALGPLTSACC